MAREISQRAPRGAAYHESAITYNERMAACARGLSDDVEDKEVKRWCRSIARQHDEHLAFHRKALERIKKQKERRKLNRQNTKNRPKPKKDTQEQETPKRPIPRDPRLGKVPPVAQLPEAGVETTNEEKQEASA